MTKDLTASASPKPPSSPRWRSIPLRAVLVLPFALEIALAVGLTGWFAARSSRLANERLALSEQEQLSHIATHNLEDSLDVHVTLAELNALRFETNFVTLDDRDRLQTMFWQQLQSFEEVTSLAFVNPDGEGVGVVRTEDGRLLALAAEGGSSLSALPLDADGSPRDVPPTPIDFDPRQRLWYRRAIARDSGAWNPVQPFPLEPLSPTLNFSRAVRRDGELLGVIVVGLDLAEINSFLEHDELSSFGETFLVNREGTLLATSSAEAGAERDRFLDDVRQQVPATDSSFPIVQAIARQLQPDDGNWESFDRPKTLRLPVNGEDYFVRVLPFRPQGGLQWTVVVGLPEASFIGYLDDSTRQTVIVCLLAILVAGGIGWGASQWVTRPVARLQAAARAVAGGAFQRRVAVRQPRELADLADSFNQMSDDLERSQLHLEAEVAERTRELEAEMQQREAIAAQLRLSEARYRLISEGTQDAIVLLKNGRFIDCNPAAVRLYGVDLRDNLCGRSPSELSPELQPDGTPSDVAAAQHIQRAIERGSHVFEWLHQRLDGSPFHAEVRLTSIELDGTLVIQAAVRDITARKRAEADLREREEQYRTLVEAANCIILRWNVRGEITFVNGYGEQFFGYSSESLVGTPVSKLISEELISESDRGFGWQAYAEQIAHDPDCQRIHENLNLRRDGTEVWVVWANQPIYDGDGKLFEILSVGTDATERKRAEEELRRSEERWQLALQGSNDGIWDFNVRTGHSFFSDRCLEMVGYRAEDLDRFETWLSYVHPEDAPRLKETFERHLRGEAERYVCEYRFRVKSGEYRWFFVRGKALWDDDGTPQRVLGSLTDITQRKRAETELLRAKDAADAASKAKSEFISNMSHELRTPLNGILGYTQIFQRQLDELPPSVRNGVRVIHQCGTHLLTLIEDILDFSKIEADRMTIAPSVFHFPSFLNDLSAMFHLKAEQKPLDFVCEVDEALPVAVRTDRKRLRQVLINLLGNAFKFTDRGEVRFETRLLDSTSDASGDRYQIRFRVRDTGIGMDAEQCQRIFLPFEQASSPDRQSEGTGLGLTISQKIVQMMGGRLSVSSHLGEGSTFDATLWLPGGGEWGASDDTPLTGVQHVSGYRGRRRTVLLVDDKSENRAVIGELLRALDFQVIDADNGAEALEQAIAQPPDLVLTDLVMPVMDGFELIRQLRRHPDLADVPVLAASASTLASERDRGFTAGCQDFLTKPISIDELFAKLQHYLDLEWIYLGDAGDTQPSSRREDAEPNAESDPSPSEDWVLPTRDRLETLYHLAKRGSLKRLVETARQLREGDDRLSPFAERLETLAQSYQDKALLDLLERYLLETR